MRILLVLFAVAAHGAGYAATLTGTVVESRAAVNLAQVGTLDWARWPGYTHRANFISDVAITGSWSSYDGDARLIGTRLGIRASGSNASFQFTAAATTTERTLIYYVGGYQSTGRLTVSLPNAPDFVATFSPPSGSTAYWKVVTIRYRADAAAALRVRFQKVSGSTIRMQAAALQGASAPTTNRAPIISGTPPATVLVGSNYTFTPVSSDPDGNPLTFTVANLPAWATLTPTTGRIAGTPTAANVATYSNIRLSVSDGLLTTSLPAFSIQVAATATGSALLTWTPPTTNTNNTTLTNLAGFKIYWGTVRGTYTNSVTIQNPGLTSYLVDRLTPGTWYFVASAVNTQGGESPYTTVVSKTIQ
jgi:hypothetical protein